MQLLAGNDEASTGGILLESRQSEAYNFGNCGEGVESGGIMLKARHAPVVTWAKDIYLRTGGGAINDPLDKGNIVLDAGKGKSEIHTRSLFLKNYVNQSGYVANYFGLDDEIISSQRFEPVRVSFNGFMCCGNDITAGGNVTIRGQYTTEQGTFVAPVGGLIGEIEDIREVQEIIDECEEKIETNKEDGVESFPVDFDDRWYTESSAGANTVIQQAQFGFRIQDEYLTGFPVWGVPETHWEQHARLTPPGKPANWQEKGVKCGDDTSYPYPGIPYYTSPVGLEQSDHVFFNDGAGVSKDRPSGSGYNYETPTEYKKFESKSLNEYGVITNGGS